MSDSINEFTKKSKRFMTNIPQEFLYAIIIIFVGLSAFGLGHLSAQADHKQKVLLKNAGSTSEATMVIGGKVLVSKNGTKYHYPWCAGASKMKEENKRWYASVQEARAAGYLPAGNCKGLK